jgi:XTP/dITP diphosphohydrolase
MVTLLIATRNAHKVGEIRAILGGSFRYLTLDDFQRAPKTVEDAATFAGNAAKKALELAKWLLKSRNPEAGTRNRAVFVLADDSGLEVDALGGAPGVHSARFAALDRSPDSLSAGNSPDTDNNAKLLRLLKEVPLEKRSARFRCVLALAPVEAQTPECEKPNQQSAIHNPQLFEGTCEGRIGLAPRGKGGFGYDPLFIPDGFDSSFAELGEDTKNRLSHRARALAGLKRWLDSRPAVSS